MEYTFAIELNDGELATIEADSLAEAKDIFRQMFPEAVGKVSCITSENGYEEFLEVEQTKLLLGVKCNYCNKLFELTLYFDTYAEAQDFYSFPVCPYCYSSGTEIVSSEL